MYCFTRRWVFLFVAVLSKSRSDNVDSTPFARFNLLSPHLPTPNAHTFKNSNSLHTIGVCLGLGLHTFEKWPYEFHDTWRFLNKIKSHSPNSYIPCIWWNIHAKNKQWILSARKNVDSHCNHSKQHETKQKKAAADAKQN